MSETVTPRVLIAKKELDELKATVAYYEKHYKPKLSVDSSDANDASVKSGAGEVYIGPSGDCNSGPTLPNFGVNDKEEISDIRNGAISDKDILLQGATKVLLPEHKELLPDEKGSSISYEDILSYIRKRFQKKALKLLNELAKHPMAISYDGKGVVTINGTLIENSNIQGIS